MRSWAALVLFAIAACSNRPTRTGPTLAAKRPEARRIAPWKPAPSPPSFRLPRLFAPMRYDASLSLNGQPYFDATISITGDVIEPATVIWLHAKHLIIYSATATHDGTTVELAVSPQPKHETIALVADKPLAAGRWTLTIEYRGWIADHGEIRSQDVNASAEPPSIGVFSQVVDGHRYTFTNFEPMDARRAFPCIDEPDRKVPWQLTLDVDNDALAISNTDITSETALPQNRKRIRFAPTAALPSYSIAFAVGPFELTDVGISADGARLRIATLRGRGNDATWIRGWPAKMIDAIAAWTDIRFPYPKLDFVAVPRPGPHWAAMENAGMITFDASLLRRPSSWIGVMEHEVAHQWFGNLVTLAWWDDIWLNEAFAVWMATKIRLPGPPPDPPPDAVALARMQTMPWMPENPPTSFRPPASAIESPRQLARYFSGELASGVVTMLEHQLGAASFQKAIRRYLHEHAHGNATSADLASVLSDVAGYPVEGVLFDVLDNRPRAKLGLSTTCTGPPTLHVQRFTAVDHPVPVCFAIDRDGARADRCVVVEGAAKDIDLGAKRCPTWIFPDPMGASLVELAWGSQNLNDVLNHGWSHLTPREQLEVWHRSMFAASHDTKLRILSRLLQSDDPAVSDEAAYMMADFFERYVPEDLRGRFVGWVKAHFLERAQGIYFRAPPPRSDGWGSGKGVVALIAVVRDPVIAARALDFVANTDANVFNPWREPLTAIAADSDRAFAERVFGDARKAHSPHALRTLAKSRFAVDLARTSTMLSTQEAIALLTGRCDRARRAEVVALSNLEADVKTKVLEQLDKCIAAGKQFDATFRAWLGPVPSSKRAAP